MKTETNVTVEIPISQITIGKRLREADPKIVNEIAASMQLHGELQDPVVNIRSGTKLIAGLHRLMANKQLGKETIRCKIVDVSEEEATLLEIAENLDRKDLHYMERAILINERKKIYEQLYPESRQYSPEKQRQRRNKNSSETVAPGYVQSSAENLGLSKRTIQHDLNLATDLDESVQKEIMDLSIGKKDALQLAKYNSADQKKVVARIRNKEVDTKSALKSLRSEKKREELAAKDFTTYADLIKLSELKIDFKTGTDWYFPRRREGYGQEHFGSTPADLVFNLLYYHTDQGDLVWDICAGGGTVHDVAKVFGRKCFSTDLNPKRPEIVQMNVLKEQPDIDPKLILFDPPYWKQAKGKYSDDAEDFGNMVLDKFYSEIDNLLKRISEKYKSFTIAVLIGNTQLPDENKGMEEHGKVIFDLLSKYFTFDSWIDVPYPMQVYNGGQVERAKREKRILNQHRDLLLFKSK